MDHHVYSFQSVEVKTSSCVVWDLTGDVSCAPVFQWHVPSWFLSSPRLCIIIVRIHDLFVFYSDSLIGHVEEQQLLRQLG